MPKAVRVGDNSTGHGCFPGRPATAGSPDMTWNGAAAMRVGDPWATHCCGLSCHSGVSTQGSPDTTVNGIPAVRVGDAISCGDAAGTGSPDSTINGG